MRMSVYITDIYFPGVGNVSNYNLQELNINCLSKIHGIYRLFYKLVSVLCPLIPYMVESRVKLVFQYLIFE